MTRKITFRNLHTSTGELDSVALGGENAVADAFIYWTDKPDFLWRGMLESFKPIYITIDVDTMEVEVSYEV